jgi:hypothetical protein
LSWLDSLKEQTRVVSEREVALCAFQAFALVGEVERFDSGAAGVVGILEDTHVDTDAPLRLLGPLRWVRCPILVRRSIPSLLDPSGRSLRKRS